MSHNEKQDAQGKIHQRQYSDTYMTSWAFQVALLDHSIKKASLSWKHLILSSSFFYFVAFCYITITAKYSQRFSPERIPQCTGFPSSPSGLCPLLWLRRISLHGQTMPQFSQLMVNWSNAIPTAILAETEHDRSALSRTHAYVLTHTFVSATKQKLELKGHVNHCSQTFCQWVTVVFKRAWGKIW